MNYRDDDLYSDPVLGDACPECGSDNTEILGTTKSGFARMTCHDCDHDWIGD